MTHEILTKTTKQMNKFLTALMLLAFAAIYAKAQPAPGTTTIYPRLGVNLSKFAGDEIFTDASGESVKSKYKFGVVAGAEVEHQFTPYFAASAGLLYSMQGTRYDESYVYDPNGSYNLFKDMKYTMHYLNLPILAVFNIGNSGFSAKCGVQLGYLLNATSNNYFESGHVIDGQRVPNEPGSDGSATVTNVFHKLDFSIPAGISYQYKNLTVDLRYNIAITGNVYKYVEDGAKNSCISLILGYGFTL